MGFIRVNTLILISDLISFQLPPIHAIVCNTVPHFSYECSIDVVAKQLVCVAHSSLIM
jgi:hypothetical protein